MPKGFTYKWPITKNSSDSASFARSIIENFKDVLVFINSYVVTKEIDGSTVVVEDMVVSGTLSVGNAPYGQDGEYIHMYRDASQALTGGSWETIAINNIVGTAGATFIADAPNNEIDAQKPGIYLVVGQVEFNAAEAGDLRITVGGTEVARAPYSVRTGGQVTALISIPSAAAIKMQAFNSGAATVNAGSNASYLRVVRLYSLV